MKFALETICRSAIGYEISQDTINKLAESYDSGVNELTRRFKGEAPTPEREEVLQQSLAGFREVALEAVERRRSLKQDDQFGVFIDFLLHEDEEVIFSDLISFMVAGFHTSGTALFWAWDAIGRYQNV
jgi:cytochrome P450